MARAREHRVRGLLIAAAVFVLLRQGEIPGVEPVGYWPRTRRYRSGSMARVPDSIGVAVIVVTSCGSIAILSAPSMCVNVEVD